KRRSEKGRNENASDKAVDLRQPKRWNAFDVGRSKHCHRPSIEDLGLGRRSGESLAFVQQPGVLDGAAWSSAGSLTKSRCRRNTGGKGWRVASASNRLRDIPNPSVPHARANLQSQAAV